MASSESSFTFGMPKEIFDPSRESFSEMLKVAAISFKYMLSALKSELSKPIVSVPVSKHL